MKLLQPTHICVTTKTPEKTALWESRFNNLISIMTSATTTLSATVAISKLRFGNVNMQSGGHGNIVHRLQLLLVIMAVSVVLPPANASQDSTEHNTTDISSADTVFLIQHLELEQIDDGLPDVASRTAQLDRLIQQATEADEAAKTTKIDNTANRVNIRLGIINSMLAYDIEPELSRILIGIDSVETWDRLKSKLQRINDTLNDTSALMDSSSHRPTSESDQTTQKIEAHQDEEQIKQPSGLSTDPVNDVSGQWQNDARRHWQTFKTIHDGLDALVQLNTSSTANNPLFQDDAPGKSLGSTSPESTIKGQKTQDDISHGNDLSQTGASTHGSEPHQDMDVLQQQARIQLSILLEHPSPHINAIATLLDLHLRNDMTNRRRTLRRLPYVLQSTTSQMTKHDFIIRLQRCRLIAMDGGYATALALLLKVEEHCHDWFDEEHALTTVRTTVLIEMDILKQWYDALDPTTQAEQRVWCVNQATTRMKQHFSADQHEIIRLQQTIPMIVDVDLPAVSTTPTP